MRGKKYRNNTSHINDNIAMLRKKAQIIQNKFMSKKKSMKIFQIISICFIERPTK